MVFCRNIRCILTVFDLQFPVICHIRHIAEDSCRILPGRSDHAVIHAVRNLHRSFLHCKMMDDSGAFSFCKIRLIRTVRNRKRIVCLDSDIRYDSGIIMICRKYDPLVLAMLDRRLVSRIAQIRLSCNSSDICHIRRDRSGILTAADHAVFSDTKDVEDSDNPSDR